MSREPVGESLVLAARMWGGRLILISLLVAAVGAWAWITFGDPYRSFLLFDLINLALAVFFVWIFHRYVLFPKNQRLNYWLTAYLVLFTWWTLLSLTSFVITEPLPVHPERFSAEWSHPDPIEHGVEWQDQPFALALSGGGYRAAVFHAGALDTIERLGLQPTHLSTVSGGSIIGSFYWRGGSPVEFKNAVANSRFNLKRKALTLPNAALLLTPWFDRLDLQASLLDEILLEDVRHGRAPGSTQPFLVVNATDLSHGLQVGFLPSAVFITGPFTRFIPWDPYASLDIPLSKRVAISGAFPIAFPSAKFNIEPVFKSDDISQLVLVDGGIGDNSGYELMTRLAALGCDTQTIPSWCIPEVGGTKAVSDGGAVFAINTELSSLGALSQMFDVSLRLRESWLERKERADVSITPQSGFFNVEQAFSHPDRENALNDDGIGVRNVAFDPINFPVVILRELGRLLPNEEDVAAFEQHLAQFESMSTFHEVDSFATPRHRLFRYNSHGMGPPSHMKSYDECIGRLVPEYPNPELCEAVGMRLLVLEQLKRDMLVFADTETLSDSFTEERAASIFRAGQFLVLLRWHYFMRSVGPENRSGNDN